jgi:uncharacterized integral membrane protein
MARDDGTQEQSSPITPQRVAVAVLLVLVVAFVLDNTDDVRIGYVFGESDIPLIIVLLAVFVAGIAVGWLSGRRGRR